MGNIYVRINKITHLNKQKQKQTKMKTTKIMLAVIATFLITWCVVGIIGYLLSDFSYRECMNDCGTVLFMLIFGWIPCVIIGADLDNQLNN